MSTYAEKTREKMLAAKAFSEMKANDEKKREKLALGELRTTGVQKWVKFEVERIIAEADKAAEDTKGKVEIKLPAGTYGYYDILRRRYHDTLGQFDIESVIPTVHKTIVSSLRASGYKVTDPKEKEFPYEYDGMPMTHHRKVVTVSW